MSEFEYEEDPIEILNEEEARSHAKDQHEIEFDNFVEKDNDQPKKNVRGSYENEIHNENKTKNNKVHRHPLVNDINDNVQIDEYNDFEENFQNNNNNDVQIDYEDDKELEHEIQKLKELVFVFDDEEDEIIEEVIEINDDISREEKNNAVLSHPNGEGELLLLNSLEKADSIVGIGINKEKELDKDKEEKEKEKNNSIIPKQEELAIILQEDSTTHFKKLEKKESHRERLLSDVNKKEHKQDKSPVHIENKRKIKSTQAKIEMKDKKIKLNLEDVEKQYLSGDKNTFEGDFDSNNPDQMQRIQEDLEKLHPRKIKDGKLAKYPICASTGWFCCGGNCGKSEIDKLGIGILCYFKVLKVYLICFLLISIINIPLIYIYYSNHTEQKVSNYRDALFKSTIGNIAANLYNCAKLPFSSIFTGNTYTDYMNLNLNCVNSVVTSIVAFGLSSDVDTVDETNIFACTQFSTVNNIQISKSCDFSTYLNQILETNCLGKTQCQIQVDLGYINSNCDYTYLYDYFFFSYECHDDYVKTGYNNILMSRSVTGFIIVGVDIASIMILLICLFVISQSQKSNEETYKENNILISDYTLHLKGIKFAYKGLHKEIGVLINHLKSVMQIEIQNDKKQSKPTLENVGLMNDVIEDFQFKDAKIKVDVKQIEQCFLFDVNYAMLTSNKLDNIITYNKYELERNKTDRELTSKIDTRDKSVSEKESLNVKLKLIEEKIRKTQENIKKEDEVKNVNELFLTFRNQQIAKFFQLTYKKNKCVRCCYIFCCKFDKIKHLYFKGQWLNLTVTRDEPTNINWQNLTYNSFKRFLRRILSILIALLVMMVSFGVVIGSKYSLDQISKQFNTNINCDYVDYTEALVMNEFVKNKTAAEKINTYCYCLDSLVKDGYTATENKVLPIDTQIQPCKEWISLFIQFNSITMGIVIIIPVVNSILIIFMKWLSLFEKSKTLTEQLSSSMWKMFLLQFINTGLVIVLVNIKIAAVQLWWKDSPIFTGDFSDLDPGWYLVVGVTILFTMIINIIIPHLAILLGLMITHLLRCFDGGCSCARKTSKKYKKDYFELYMGPDFPIDVRYASMLTTIFVSLVYSSGIPILYVCILAYLIFTYIVDKILILRFYKSPPKYDLYVARIFNFYIMIALIVHYLVAIWIYGNPGILSDKNTSSALLVITDLINKYLDTNNQIIQNIVRRISLQHNILCLIFLALLIAILIIRVTVYSFFEAVCRRSSYEKKKNLEIGLAIPFKLFYKNYELRKIQFMKFMKLTKSQEEKERVVIVKSKKSSSEYNMKNFFQVGINYDRELLKYKMEKMTGKELINLERNFDEEIKQLFIQHPIEEDPIISGDVSFNIAYIQQYESIAYYEYLKNIY